MNTIKELVEKALEEKGISAKKMLEDLEMSDATYYQIIRKNSGRPKTLKKIGEYLGINLNISFGQNEDVSTLQKLVDYLKKENQFLRTYIDENLMVGMGKFDVINLPRVSANFFCLY